MKYFLVLFCLVTMTGCPKEIPKFEKDIYVGDSSAQSLQHKQDGKVVRPSDPKFDQMICMTEEDFACLFETYISNSKGWSRQSACGLQPSK